MKKAIFAILLLAATVAVKAQTNLKVFQTDQTIHVLGLDTAINAAGAAPILSLPGYYDLITVQGTVTKISGTVGGSLKLYGSVDGIAYSLATATTDTLAVANVAPAQVYSWTLTPSKFLYYKVQYTSLSSQTSQLRARALAHKAGQ